MQTRDKIIDGFPGRRGYGTKGKPIVLRANYFVIKEKGDKPLYRYEIAISQELSKPKRRRLFDVLMQDPMFAKTNWATDYASILVTTDKLDLSYFVANEKGKAITLPPEAGQISAPTPQGAGPAPDFVRQARDRNTFHFRVNYQSSFSLHNLTEYLKSTSAGADYAGRSDLIQMLNIIATKSPNEANAVRNAGHNTFYPHQGHPNVDLQDLGGGLDALRGYYASVRPAVSRLLLNLNVTAGAFFQPLPLLDLIKSFNNGNNFRVETLIRMLKVRAAYIKDGQTAPFMVKNKTIVGFAKDSPNPKVKRFGNAHEVTFGYTDKGNNATRSTTVFDYYKQHHGITLRRPTLPVLNVGTRADPQYMPVEMCTVLPGQTYRRLLNKAQTTSMLDFAARFPNANAMSIAGTLTQPGNGLRLFELADRGGQQDPQSSRIHRFGFSVNPEMITVPGRILEPPQLKYGARTVHPNAGSWNCANQKFVEGGRFNKWQVLVINTADGNALQNPSEPLAKALEVHLKGYGINMGQRKVPNETLALGLLDSANRSSNDRALKKVFESAQKSGVSMMLVIFPSADRWLYARIKYFGDVDFGVGTVCSVGPKIEKENGQGMYFGNLALKFNLKGGGVSHTVTSGDIKPVNGETMLVGIDVTHPSPGSADGAPSIACVVASINQRMFQWPGSIRTQKGREEMVQSLEEMVIERLDLWKKNQEKLPSQIIVYRDGVSEGQYNLVLERELPAFEKAFAKRYGGKEKWPKITIIIVGKRHHTRFYPTRQEDADYNPERSRGSWNPKPGTVVDRGIGNKALREFWLQAHQGLQGTARPAHYVVIKDELSFEADALEKFTHHLCYLFNRATKAVSICPPAYYADLLCERGRAYLFSTMNESEGSESSVFNAANEWSGGVHERLRETTWYV